MQIVRLKKAWKSEIKDVLKHEGIPDTYSYQVSEIMYDRFTVLSFKKKEKQNPLWRLTILFYLLFLVLIICTFPFKYLITGTAQYEFNSALGKFYRAWQLKLGL